MYENCTRRKRSRPDLRIAAQRNHAGSYFFRCAHQDVAPDPLILLLPNLIDLVRGERVDLIMEMFR
jgi:hypothetical protein